MSAEFLCDPLELNCAHLKLGKIGRGRGSMVRLFRNKTPIQLKTDVVKSVYGAQLNTFKKDKDEFYMDITSNNDNFCDAISQIDSQIVSQIAQNLSLFDASGWNEDEIRKEFFGIKRNSFGSGCTIRLQLPKNDLGQFDFHVFDKDKCEISLDKDNVTTIIGRDTVCKVIFELDRVWFFQNRFGIVCKLRQLKLEDAPKVIDYAIDDDDEDCDTASSGCYSSTSNDASTKEGYLFVD
jgi:hypothetical protein